MKKICGLIVFCLGAGLLAHADNWMSITGSVTKVRQGTVSKAVFYTIIAQDGSEYLANTGTAQVEQNESVFKEAYATKSPLCIEFIPNEKWTNSIWRIRKIEIQTNSNNQSSNPNAGN